MALIVHKPAQLAEQELPSVYHLPRDEPCAGGCGQTLGPFSYDEDKTWYFVECGLTAEINHLCARCASGGKRTIVFSLQGLRDPAPPDTLCYQCEYEVNVASGAWHICPVCTGVVQARLQVQRLCEHCQVEEDERKARRRAYQREYRDRKKAGKV